MANEKRLIDANDLRTQFDEIPPFIGLTGGCVQQYIDKAPTVDAVEVVRCRVCIFGEQHDLLPCRWRCTNPKCVKSFYGCEVHPDHYCSFGERKPNEDNPKNP